jgi:hypothetical protein
MFARGIRLAPWYAFLGASYHVSLRTSVCESKKAPSDAKKTPDTISVFLKDDSNDLFKKALEPHGLQSAHFDRVCVVRSADSGLVNVYAPLFGQRMAFRLKGIIKLDDGSAVGIGRVSNMVGEMKEMDYEVSLPLAPAGSDSSTIEMLQDLPTRLLPLPDIYNKHYWVGRIPPGTVNGRHYRAVHAQLFHLPVERQVVIDGYLCSNNHYNKDLKRCEFDEEDFFPLADSPTEVLIPHQHTEAQPEQHEEQQPVEQSRPQEVEDPDECPMCRYMKKGPCRDSFIAWDKCIKGLGENDELNVCFQQTKEMMKCMQHHEYYDIMVAGTDYSKFEQAERLATQQQDGTGKQENH